MDRMNRLELHYRAAEGDLTGIAERLLAGDPVDARGKAGFTPLHFAAQQSHGPAARALLRAGAEVDRLDRYGDTPLWRAIFNCRGEDETVSILLQAGADPDVDNASGVSPRALAERLGKLSLLTSDA